MSHPGVAECNVAGWRVGQGGREPCSPAAALSGGQLCSNSKECCSQGAKCVRHQPEYGLRTEGRDVCWTNTLTLFYATAVSKDELRTLRLSRDTSVTLYCLGPDLGAGCAQMNRTRNLPSSRQVPCVCCCWGGGAGTDTEFSPR